MVITAALRKRLKRVKAVVLDVDGVMTDAGMYFTAEGDTMKKFNTRDGMGIRFLREAGYKIAFITGEASPIVSRRAEKLQVADVYLGVQDKLAALRDFCAKHGVALAEVAYCGDDVNDLPCLGEAGLAVAPADALPPVRKVAHVLTVARGGEGVVRELADAILGAR